MVGRFGGVYGGSRSVHMEQPMGTFRLHCISTASGEAQSVYLGEPFVFPDRERVVSIAVLRKTLIDIHTHTYMLSL